MKNTDFQKWLNENYRQSVYPDYLLPKDCDYPLINIRDATTKFFQSAPVPESPVPVQPEKDKSWLHNLSEEERQANFKETYNPKDKAVQDNAEGFTPGEWHPVYSIAFLHPGQPLISVSIRSDKEHQLQKIAMVECEETPKAEAEANARLIAEAPKMLQLIKELTAAIELISGNNEYPFKGKIEKAKAILNRITNQ